MPKLFLFSLEKLTILISTIMVKSAWVKPIALFEVLISIEKLFSTIWVIWGIKKILLNNKIDKIDVKQNIWIKWLRNNRF